MDAAQRVTSVEGIGVWTAAGNVPAAGPAQRAPNYLYGLNLWFTGAPALGVVGLGVNSTGRYAMLALAGPGGVAEVRAVRLDWAPGRLYFPFVWQQQPNVWAAAVYDAGAGQWVEIGTISVPAGWGSLSATTLTTAGWYGARPLSCAAYPPADVYFAPPIGVSAGRTFNASPAGTGVISGDCAGTAAPVGNGTVRYRLAGA